MRSEGGGVSSRVVNRSPKVSAEVRRSLQPIRDLAEELGCAVFGISHYTKGSAGRDPVERVTGSVAFGAVPRVVFAAAKKREDEGGGRIFVRAKRRQLDFGPTQNWRDTFARCEMRIYEYTRVKLVRSSSREFIT